MSRLAPETRQAFRDTGFAIGTVLGSALVVFALGVLVLWALEVITR